jgi:hypothetical protein
MVAMAYGTQWIRSKHNTMAVDAINCIIAAKIPHEPYDNKLRAPGYVAGRRRIAARTETSGPASQIFPTKSKRSSASGRCTRPPSSACGPMSIGSKCLMAHGS